MPALLWSADKLISRDLQCVVITATCFRCSLMSNCDCKTNAWTTCDWRG